MNELVLVKTNLFKKEGMEADKNGMNNVFLEPIAGKMPNQAMVVAGTVAESNGLVAGNLQLVLVNELAPSEQYGRQFSVTVLDGDIPGKDVIGYRKELGSAIVVDTKGAIAEAPAKPTANTSTIGGAPAATVAPKVN